MSPGRVLVILTLAALAGCSSTPESAPPIDIRPTPYKLVENHRQYLPPGEVTTYRVSWVLLTVGELRFDVRDARSGAELRGMRVSLTNGTGSYERGQTDAAGRAVMTEMPRAGRKLWRIELDGYATLEGDETAFTGTAREGGRDVLVASVELAPD